MVRGVVLLVVCLAGCPDVPPPDSPQAGDSATTGGEAPPAAASFPASPLTPLALEAEAQARASMPPEAQSLAFVTRADVAMVDADGARSWFRVGLVLGPSGLRLFQLAPHPVERDAPSTPPGTDGAGALRAAIDATARGQVPLLGAEECDALGGEPICGPLRTLAGRAEDPRSLAGRADVVAMVGQALVLRGTEGLHVLDLTGGGPPRAVEIQHPERRGSPPVAVGTDAPATIR